MRRAWLVLLLAPGACLFPDLGNLEGDAASDVAATDVIDAAAIESSTEAGNADAPPEAGYCSSLGGTHALCEDFDENTAFSSQFTSVHQSANGAVGNDTSIVVTPPRSLAAGIAAAGTKLGDDAYMKRNFSGIATKATYSFDFRVDSLPPGESGVFAGITFDDGLPDHHTLAIYLTDTYASVEEAFPSADSGTLYKDHPLSLPIPIGKWARVSFGVDTVAHTCSVSIDGQPALVSAPIDASWVAGTVAINLGFSYVSSETTAWQARYDDVVFDFQ